MSNKILNLYTNKNNNKYKNIINELKNNLDRIKSHNIKVKIINDNLDLILELKDGENVIYRTRNPILENMFKKLEEKNNINEKTNLLNSMINKNKKTEIMLKKYYKLKYQPKKSEIEVKSLKVLKKLLKQNQIGGSYEFLDYNLIKYFFPLIKKYGMEKEIDYSFLKIYKKYNKSYLPNLKIDNTNWNTYRNNFIRNKLKEKIIFFNENGYPSKQHLELIMWGFSPNVNKLKKIIKLFNK